MLMALSSFKLLHTQFFNVKIEGLHTKEIKGFKLIFKNILSFKCPIVNTKEKKGH